MYHVPLHRVLAFFNMIAAIVDVMYPADLGSAKPPAGFENTRAWWLAETGKVGDYLASPRRDVPRLEREDPCD